MLEKSLWVQLARPGPLDNSIFWPMKRTCQVCLGQSMLIRRVCVDARVMRNIDEKSGEKKNLLFGKVSEKKKIFFSQICGEKIYKSNNKTQEKCLKRTDFSSRGWIKRRVC